VSIDRLLSSSRATAALIVVLALASYASAFDAGFVWDDRPVVLEDARVRGSAPWSTILTRPYGSSVALDPLWRPVVVLSYALDHAIWGPSPVGFHATSLAIHVAACLALWLALRQLVPRDPAVPALAALLFSVHPVHVEAVTWISGRSDALGGLFAALAILSWSRARAATGRARLGWTAACAGAYLLGLLSKEVVALLPAFLAAWEWVRAQSAEVPATPATASPAPAAGRHATSSDAQTSTASGPTGSPAGSFGLSLRPLLLLAGVFAGWLAVRAAVLGGSGGLSLFVAWKLDAGTRIRAAGAVLVDHLRLLLWPARLAADYAVNRDPAAAVAAAGSVAGWLGLVLAAGALPLAAGLARRRPAVALGLLWHAIFLFPASNLAIGIGVVEAERLLYLPSAGFLLALVAFLAGDGGRRRAAACAVLLLALLPLSLRTFLRNLDWRDDERLYRSMIRAEPRNPYAHTMLGTVLIRSDRLDEAGDCFAAALGIKPDDALAFAGRGELRRRRGDLPGALADLDRALALAPVTRTRVARALARLEAGGFETASRELRAITLEDPQNADGWNGLGAMHLLRKDDLRAALEAFETAARLRPGDAAILSNRGLARLYLGERAAALRDQEEAIRLDPQLADAHKRRGVALYAPEGSLEEAERSLREAARLAPTDAEAHNYLVLVLCARGDRAGVADQLSAMLARGIPVRPEVADEAAGSRK